MIIYFFVSIIQFNLYRNKSPWSRQIVRGVAAVKFLVGQKKSLRRGLYFFPLVQKIILSRNLQDFQQEETEVMPSKTSSAKTTTTTSHGITPTRFQTR